MADDFAKTVRELYSQAEEADRTNCEEAMLDLNFEAFDQWDERVRNYRESHSPFPLPCLTINVAQQYTGLVVGDWLANETSITALPREDGDVKIAEVRSELIRSIELQSKADRVYASSLGQSSSCGISNFRVDIDDARDNPFIRDIFIRDIPNPLAVKWDPFSFDPTGRDATYCFVGDEISDDEYTKRFPKAARPSLIQKDGGTSWAKGGKVTLPEYWRIDERLRTIGMTVDGKTVDLTDIDQKKWPQLAIDPDTGKPIVREKVKCKYAVMVITNGVEPLTDPFELKLHRLPIIRVMGREVWTDKGRVRFGLGRCIRDSQRMKNYLRSIRAELLMRAPRENFVAEAKSIEGREADWDATLVYNDGTQKPEQITLENITALLNEERIYTQDMMDTTGIHEASRGMPSNETSGVAIKARQQEGDIATIIFHHNMTSAQQEAGEVVNALIPTVIDTARTLRIVGPDMGVKMVRVNDPNDPESIDIGTGTYDIIISTGPRYQTRRQQASDSMLALIQADKSLAGVIGDLFMKEQDVPGADKMAERIKRTIPPQILGDDADDGKDPEQLQAQQQKAAEAEQLQQANVQLEMQAKQADTRLKVAQAEKAEAEALKAKAEALQVVSGAPDPSIDAEQTRTAIDGYQAVTARLKVLSDQKDAPDALEQHLTPIIANAIGQALARHLNFAPAELGLPEANVGQTNNEEPVL